MHPDFPASASLSWRCAQVRPPKTHHFRGGGHRNQIAEFSRIFDQEAQTCGNVTQSREYPLDHRSDARAVDAGKFFLIHETLMQEEDLSYSTLLPSARW
jgi:hypothetical protein